VPEGAIPIAGIRSLENACQVAATVDDTHNLNFINRPAVGVGVGLVEDEIRLFDKKAGGWRISGRRGPRCGWEASNSVLASIAT
jgi:hypothetical protein